MFTAFRLTVAVCLFAVAPASAPLLAFVLSAVATANVVTVCVDAMEASDE